ncbi:MAG: TetR/AcrR family transcriptional regulator [Mesorhizobium sp.]
MLNLDSPQTPEEAKRNRILEGAMKVVLAYGYHRTTMDDVAKAAEMSRPALYLMFRNKADIYRAIATTFFHASATRMGEILAEDGPFGERLFRGVNETMIEVMQQICQSPHGAELLDMKSELCGGAVEDWNIEVTALFAEAITREAARLGTDLASRGTSADQLGAMLHDGFVGLKMRASDADDQRAGVRHLIHIVELTLA